MSRPDEMGRRWLLQTDRGRWAPRTVDDVYPVTDGEDNARFQEAAARAGVTLPAPVRSASGAVVEVIDGSQWRVYEWLRSGPPLAAPGQRDRHPRGRGHARHPARAPDTGGRHVPVEFRAVRLFRLA
jgi:hypothetical protein